MTKFLVAAMLACLLSEGVPAQEPKPPPFHANISVGLTSDDSTTSTQMLSIIQGRLRQMPDVSVVFSDAEIELKIVTVRAGGIIAVSWIATKTMYPSVMLNILQDDYGGLNHLLASPNVHFLTKALELYRLILSQEVMTGIAGDPAQLAERIVSSFDINVLNEERKSWEDIWRSVQEGRRKKSSQ